MFVIVHVSYCSQMLSKDIDECVTELLKELVRFQDRLYQKDPMKARMKRRIVMGLREVLKHLKLRKVKCVIISPNCERIQSKGTGCTRASLHFFISATKRVVLSLVPKTEIVTVYEDNGESTLTQFLRQVRA